MRFKRYLVERTMTFELALKVFGITADDAGDKDLLKKKYRKLSMKYHPDHGGSLEKQQDVNDAFEVLSKAVSIIKKEKSRREEWEEIDKKYRMAGAQIKTSLLSDFRPEIFIQYFEEMSGYRFTHKITKTYPSETERSPSFAGFDAEFFTKDRNTVFTFKIHTQLNDIVWPKNELGFGNLKYKVYTEAHGFHMNKKQKMSKSDWSFTRDHSFFRKPEQLFPRKKMKDIFSGKTSKRKFQKRDMITFLTKKLGASWDGDYARIPLGEDYQLVVYRIVFMRMGTWGVNGIYFKYGRQSQGPTTAFMEEEETAKIFEKIQKEVKKVKGEAKIKKAEKLIKFAWEAYRKSKGE